MSCILKDHLKEAHARATDQRTLDTQFNCPLIGDKICFWCCLHIVDLANPRSRPLHTEKFADYEKVVAEYTGRSWDDMWRTCSVCKNRA